MSEKLASSSQLPRSASRFLPYGRQSISADDIKAVSRVLTSDYLTTGPEVARFEEDLANLTGAPHAVVCSSGTAALHLAARALGLGPGDHVIVPTTTFVATANAPHFTGAEIIFADTDPETGLMGASELEEAISRLPAGGKRALYHVHLNGQTGNLPSIHALARKHGLTIVEDACHALGTNYRTAEQGWNQVGDCLYADLTVFSFHPVKSIAAGEGGAVLCRDATLAERLRRDRSHGLERNADTFVSGLGRDIDGSKAPWAYEMTQPGFNYRLSDLHAALGRSQLGRLDLFVAERRRLSAHYDLKLSALWPAVRPIARSQHSVPAWHLYAVLIDFARVGRTRSDVMQELRARGIGTQVHYIPVHTQPYYADRYGQQDLPGALAYFDQCLSLPLFVGMTEDDTSYVISALKDLF